MNKTSKRLLGIALAALLVAVALIGGVSAEPTEVSTQADLVAALATDDGAKLMSDIQLSESNLTIKHDTVLDLNGHVLTGTGNGSVITMKDGITLTITDSNPTINHYFTVDSNGLWTWVGDTQPGTGEYETLTCGVITGGITVKYGGGVLIDSGTLVMKGGAIVGNQAVVGGGIEIDSDSSNLHLIGGTIKGNIADDGSNNIDCYGGKILLTGVAANIDIGGIYYYLDVGVLPTLEFATSADIAGLGDNSVDICNDDGNGLLILVDEYTGSEFDGVKSAILGKFVGGTDFSNSNLVILNGDVGNRVGYVSSYSGGNWSDFAHKDAMTISKKIDSAFYVTLKDALDNEITTSANDEVIISLLSDNVTLENDATLQSGNTLEIQENKTLTIDNCSLEVTGDSASHLGRLSNYGTVNVGGDEGVIYLDNGCINIYSESDLDNFISNIYKKEGSGDGYFLVNTNYTVGNEGVMTINDGLKFWIIKGYQLTVNGTLEDYGTLVFGTWGESQIVYGDVINNGIIAVKTETELKHVLETGSTIRLDETLSLTDDITVPDGITLSLSDDVTLSAGSHKFAFEDTAKLSLGSDCALNLTSSSIDGTDVYDWETMKEKISSAGIGAQVLLKDYMVTFTSIYTGSEIIDDCVNVVETNQGTHVTMNVQAGYEFTVPDSVILSKDTSAKVTGDGCKVIATSDMAVEGKKMVVTIESEADKAAEGYNKELFSLNGSGNNKAVYLVGNNDSGKLYEGKEPVQTNGNVVISQVLTAASTVSQQIFFQTHSFDAADTYNGTLMFNFEVVDA